MTTAIEEPVKPQVDAELPPLAEYENTALVLRQRVDLVKIETDDQYRSVAQATLDAAANAKALRTVLEPLRVRRYDALQRVYDVLEKAKKLEEIKDKGARLTAHYKAEQKVARQKEEERQRALQLEDAKKRQEQEATQLANEGRVEEGIAVLESQPEVLPVVAPITVPKVAGIGGKVTWVYKAKIVDLMALVKAVAEGRAPIQVLGSQDRITKLWDITTGQDFLDDQADSYKEAFDFPGCKLVKDVKKSSVRAPR